MFELDIYRKSFKRIKFEGNFIQHNTEQRRNHRSFNFLSHKSLNSDEHEISP